MQHSDGDEPHTLTRAPRAARSAPGAGSAPLLVTPLFLVAVPP